MEKRKFSDLPITDKLIFTALFALYIIPPMIFFMLGFSFGYAGGYGLIFSLLLILLICLMAFILLKYKQSKG